MDLTTRELGAEDVGHWRALRAEGLRLFPGAFLMTLEESEAAGIEADRATMAHGGRFGVFDDTRCLGIGAVRPFALSRIRHRAEVGPFYISPAAQGTGAAAVLFGALADHARARGVTQLELFVAGDNARAIAFYRRHGFQRFGTVPAAVQMPDGPVDDLFLVRRLSAL